MRRKRPEEGEKSAESVVSFTFVLELPFYAEVPPGQVVLFNVDPGAEFSGWDEGHLRQLAHSADLPDPVRPPWLKLEFRTGSRRGPLPLEVADRCFSDLLKDILPRRERLRRRINLWRHMRRGLVEHRTVVAGTRYLPAADAPEAPGDEATYGWLRGTLIEVLQQLNAFLASIAITTGDPLFRRVHFGDLPAVMPLIVREHAPRRVLGGVNVVFELHQFYPAVLPISAEAASLGSSGSLFNERFSGRQPLFPFYELLIEAEGDLLTGRFAAAVRNAGTAVEIFVSEVVREAAKLKGLPTGDVDGWLDSGLKNVLQSHLARVLSLSIDLSSASDPFGAWWLTGYASRNAVVHAGHEPTEDEALVALKSIEAMYDTVLVAVDAQPVLADLAELLLRPRPGRGSG